MAYFYASSPSYLIQHLQGFDLYAQQQPDWPPAPNLVLVDPFYPAPPFNGCLQPLSHVPHAPPPPIPTYSVSYSLAGAMTPVEVPGSNPTPLHSSPSAPQPAQSFFYTQSLDGSDYTPNSVTESPLSPSPPPRTSSLKKEEDTARALDASDPPPKSQRASRVSAPSQRRLCGRAARKADDLPLQPGEKSYDCDVCGARFMRRHDWERHHRSHTGKRPFPCHGGCGKAFRRADARSKHWSVRRDCESRHTLFLEGTPEGLSRERRAFKRAKRSELRAEGKSRREIERVVKKM